MDYKRIETEWRGYRFRSRLEARWAIFLTAMEFHFLYEFEGLEFTNGTRYLADFLLTDFNLWAEVKPTSGDRAKAEALVKASGRSCLMLEGAPDFRAYDHISLLTNGTTEVEQVVLLPWKKERRLTYVWGDWDDDLNPGHYLYEKYKRAVYAARGARFEEMGK